MRSYAALTDHDFELLIADLFGAEDEARYEAFARGPDQGVDLRREDGDGILHAIQCKHYVHSTIATLRADARKEAKKLSTLDRRPKSYRFVTSRRLTRDNKRELKRDLSPFIKRQSDIWGEDDLELLLGRHPEVERRHIKLWLPSSAELQTLLSSATYSRSRALAEEISELLPRWVPGHAFHQARELLRERNVCVIAGVPGIGKTTLAKMLLADAVDDGYEAIEVSADIEEAWDVYTPERPQAFYYDDFLGRTALTDRLGKNEEDRLLRFMQRVANSRSTLFVLTTREYILQQARQLYEQLAVEGIDNQKFLLELAGYSRLDRARIFYNHAFFSESLTASARRSLLRDRAYEAIIDHGAYNPRQIEWITGLSGHALTDGDNARYVEFALEALDDPTRIWRHGFEHQLDEVQRALLLVLVTMPDRVEHDDLQRAFGAFCDAAGIATRGRAFTRALEVLDDSFIRIYHDVGSVFVRLFDPSVEDFLSGYLSESPADAELCVRGAIYFEQVTKLARLLAAPEIPPETVADEYVAAVERCFEAASCSWRDVYWGREATEPTAEREPADMEDRLDVVRRMRGWGSPYAGAPLRGRLASLSAAGLKTVVARWANGRGEEESALALIRTLKAHDELTDDVIAAAKKLVLSGLNYPYAFRHVLSLRRVVADAFTESEWTALQASFTQIAEQEFDNWEELGAVDEIDEIKARATELGVDLNPVELKRVRERVADRVAEAEERAAELAEERDYEEDPEPDDQDEEIEILFTRLANQ